MPALKECIFKRCPKNPVISVNGLPYEANSVFNPGAVKFRNETLLLMRVEAKSGISSLYTAKSADGFNDWKFDARPSLKPFPEKHPEEVWGIEDPRITCIEAEGKWAVVYTSYSTAGPLVSIALTDDFRKYERLGAVLPPENKDAALFPEKINGLWAIINRPVTSFTESADMWIAFSPDLKHWGEHRLLLEARKGSFWDAGKIGLSSPPLKTEEGWLVLYHGVRKTASGSIYRLGLALLELENPCKVIARGNEWIFSPEENYEITGDVDKVVFSCGWIPEGDEIRMYYGSADKSISVATAKLSELLFWLKEYNSN